MTAPERPFKVLANLSFMTWLVRKNFVAQDVSDYFPVMMISVLKHNECVLIESSTKWINPISVFDQVAVGEHLSTLVTEMTESVHQSVKTTLL